MAVLGLVAWVFGGLLVAASVTGRLPLVLAALFGQSPPAAPKLGSVQIGNGQASGDSLGGILSTIAAGSLGGSGGGSGGTGTSL